MTEKPEPKIPAPERLLNLSVYLLEKKKPVSLREIFSEIEGYDPSKDHDSNRRMFIRDRETLRGLDIEILMEKTSDPVTGADTEGYRIDPGVFYMERVTFSDAEVEALSRLGARLGKSGAAPLRELEWAVAKAISSGGRRSAAGAPFETVLLNFEPGEDSAKVEAVQSAISERRGLEIRYRTPGSTKGSARKVDPYGLFLRRGQWYMVGKCHLRGDARMFRLDRLEIAGGARAEARRFDIPPDFSLEDYVKRRAPWEFGDERPSDVSIRFHPDFFWQARNAWGDLDSVSFNEESLTMRLKSVNEQALFGWLLGFADGAELVSPRPARERFAAVLKQIIGNAV
jgi:proteasome accessory factor B